MLPVADRDEALDVIELVVLLLLTSFTIIDILVSFDSSENYQNR